jgi:hypothetical protein
MHYHLFDKQPFLINLHFFFFLLYRLHDHNFWDLCSKNIFGVICDVRFELWWLLLLIYNLNEIAFKLAAHVDFHLGTTLTVLIESLVYLVYAGLEEGRAAILRVDDHLI